MWYEGTTANDLGLFAEKIVKELWPEDFVTNESGSWLDLHGVDGHWHHQPVQIKADTAIPETRNFYKEMFKKTHGPNTSPSLKPWRISPCYAEYLIFVTDMKAYVISVDSFAREAIGKRLTQINPTSLGILVPMDTVDIHEERDHEYHLPRIPKEQTVIEVPNLL